MMQLRDMTNHHIIERDGVVYSIDDDHDSFPQPTMIIRPLRGEGDSAELEAKNWLAQLSKSALAGEEVSIANRGEPVARLVPAGKVAATATGKGGAHAILDWLSSHPLPEGACRSAAEIDAAIEDERASWG